MRERSLEDLSASIRTGFLDFSKASTEALQPKLITNEPELGKKVLTVLSRQLLACEEFWFSVAFATTGGISSLFQELIELQEKGIKGKILLSQYLYFTEPEAIRKLQNFDNISLRISSKRNFHSKGYLFRHGDIYDLVIGSSNLTASALATNGEWNLKVSGAKTGQIIKEAETLFEDEFASAQPVTEEFLSEYVAVREQQARYRVSTVTPTKYVSSAEVAPNQMQIRALENLRSIRESGKNRSLLVSATGTGKTYLSAFDARNFDPKRFLFIVHRENIAKAALETYSVVFGGSKSMGLYTGSSGEFDKDFVFSTIQTISREANLARFHKDHFDYIVIDETHRAGAASYLRVIEHFEPKFLLGMSATPERTDGFDVFSLYDHSIACEIRLHEALKEEMLCPFHYFGITEIEIEGEVLDENTSIAVLTSQERVDRIYEKIILYGTDNGENRGLIFCSRKDECREISSGLNRKGLKTIALTGDDSEVARERAIARLETDNTDEKLDYILTVDIFNEGIDIPRVNQVVMLRPTQSAIIFVQQLGRGLRKASGKEYLTVIDFIGNYKNSYLVPIALYGDTTYNKDSLRKLISSKSSELPGESTISFDRITKERIFDSIDSSNMMTVRDLKKDYELLKYKLGRPPLMMDFVEHGSRDPFLYVSKSQSFYNFVKQYDPELGEGFPIENNKLLELLSLEICNAKRVEEGIILDLLLKTGVTTIDAVKEEIINRFDYKASDSSIDSAIRNLNFEFQMEIKERERIPVRQKYNIYSVELKDGEITLSAKLSAALKNGVFRKYVTDAVNYSIVMFAKSYKADKWSDGFTLYNKYSRKDVFRILNWDQNPVAQNVGGYILSSDKTNFPVFVNYHKADDISATTNYDDRFINSSKFHWMSKSNRTLGSPEIQALKNYKSGLRIPLFIKKSNDEGIEFYYMGDVEPDLGSFEQSSIKNEEDKDIPVVRMDFIMMRQVEDSIYEYLVES